MDFWKSAKIGLAAACDTPLHVGEEVLLENERWSVTGRSKKDKDNPLQLSNGIETINAPDKSVTLAPGLS